MKPVIIIAIAVVIIISLTLMIPSVDAIESRNHSVSTGEQIFSYQIPIVGILSVDMKYIFDFEVLKPSSIIAGKSDEIILSPTITTLPTIPTIAITTTTDNC